MKVTGTVRASLSPEGTGEAYIHCSKCGNHTNFVARNSKLQKTKTGRIGPKRRETRKKKEEKRRGKERKTDRKTKKQINKASD